MALVKKNPNLVLGPNMPDRGVVADIDWLRPYCRPRRSQRCKRGTPIGRTPIPSGRFRRATLRR